MIVDNGFVDLPIEKGIDIVGEINRMKILSA